MKQYHTRPFSSIRIADITSLKCTQELLSICGDLPSLPIQPLLEEGQEPWVCMTILRNMVRFSDHRFKDIDDYLNPSEKKSLYCGNKDNRLKKEVMFNIHWKKQKLSRLYQVFQKFSRHRISRFWKNGEVLDYLDRRQFQKINLWESARLPHYRVKVLPTIYGAPVFPGLRLRPLTTSARASNRTYDSYAFASSLSVCSRLHKHPVRRATMPVAALKIQETSSRLRKATLAFYVNIVQGLLFRSRSRRSGTPGAARLAPYRRITALSRITIFGRSKVRNSMGNITPQCPFVALSFHSTYASSGMERDHGLIFTERAAFFSCAPELPAYARLCPGSPYRGIISYILLLASTWKAHFCPQAQGVQIIDIPYPDSLLTADLIEASVYRPVNSDKTFYHPLGLLLEFHWRHTLCPQWGGRRPPLSLPPAWWAEVRSHSVKRAAVPLFDLQYFFHPWVLHGLSGLQAFIKITAPFRMYSQQWPLFGFFPNFSSVESSDLTSVSRFISEGAGSYRKPMLSSQFHLSLRFPLWNLYDFIYW